MPAHSVQRHNQTNAHRRPQQRSQEGRQKRPAPPQERPPHRHHLHVAHAHAFAPAHSFVNRRDGPQKQAPERRSQQPVKQPEQPVNRGGGARQSAEKWSTQPRRCSIIRRHRRREKQSRPNSRPVHHVRQQSDPQIRNRQYDGQTREKQPLHHRLPQSKFQLPHHEY